MADNQGHWAFSWPWPRQRALAKLDGLSASGWALVLSFGHVCLSVCLSILQAGRGPCGRYCPPAAGLGAGGDYLSVCPSCPKAVVFTAAIARWLLASEPAVAPGVIGRPFCPSATPGFVPDLILEQLWLSKSQRSYEAITLVTQGSFDRCVRVKVFGGL
jgi:hypothetical protein